MGSKHNRVNYGGVEVKLQVTIVNRLQTSKSGSHNLCSLVLTEVTHMFNSINQDYDNKNKERACVRFVCKSAYTRNH